MRKRWLASLRGESDAGQIALVILGFAVILGLLVTVVIAASTVFLQRRALVALADSAALAAAQEVDAASLYESGSDGFVPLDESMARAAAEAQVEAFDSATLQDVRISRVTVDESTVAVTAVARVRLPFVNGVTGHPDGVVLTATSAARSPVRP